MLDSKALVASILDDAHAFFQSVDLISLQKAALRLAKYARSLEETAHQAPQPSNPDITYVADEDGNEIFEPRRLCIPTLRTIFFNSEDGSWCGWEAQDAVVRKLLEQVDFVGEGELQVYLQEEYFEEETIPGLRKWAAIEGRRMVFTAI